MGVVGEYCEYFFFKPGLHIFCQKYLGATSKFLCAGRVIRSKFSTEGTKVFVANVINLLARATCQTRLVHSCFKHYGFDLNVSSASYKELVQDLQVT